MSFATCTVSSVVAFEPVDDTLEGTAPLVPADAIVSLSEGQQVVL